MIPVSYETHKAAGDHAGELCLSPVGLALVTRIAPVSMAAMLLGVWFRASRPICWRATWREMLESEERGAVFHFLGGQADFFMILVVISLAAGALLLGIAGRLCRQCTAGDSRLGTISQRSCEVAPCIAAAQAVF